MASPTSWSDHARSALLRIDRAAVVGLLVLAVLGVVAAVAFAWHGRPQTVTYSGDGSAVQTAPAAPGAAGASSLAAPGVAPTGSGALLVIDVVGRVRRPGLVRVPAGSRVWDVVQAAGGFVREADSPTVNLARVVADGEQLVVGPPPKGLAAAPAPGGPGAGRGGAAPTAPIDLNTATREALETLPGVGPVLAQRILDHRSLNGPFRSVEELRDVSGIGDKTFADLAPRVRV